MNKFSFTNEHHDKRKLSPTFVGKGKSPGVPFHGITSQYSYLKKFEFLRPFSKAAEKT